ncbi:MAG: DsrE family protein [Bacteroidales bacterium]
MKKLEWGIVKNKLTTSGRKSYFVIFIIFLLLVGCTPNESKTERQANLNLASQKSITKKKMKIAIVIDTKEAEKAWNAFRFAVAATKKGHQVKVFLMGEAVECEGFIHEKYNVDEQLKKFVEEGGEILACGTCLKARQKEGTEACPLSTMNDCVEMVEWADQVLTF